MPHYFGTLSVIFKHNRAEQALKFGALLKISATSVCTRGPSELFLIIIGLDLCSLGRRNIIYKSHIARVCREILISLKIKHCIYRMLNTFIRGISHHLYNIKYQGIGKTYLKNTWQRCRHHRRLFLLFV